MKLKNNLIIISIALVCVITAYCADNEPKSPKVPVNLDECIELGLMDSSLLRSAFLDFRSAEALLNEMRMQYVPSVIVSGGYTRLSETDPAQITLPPPINSTVTLSPSITDSYLINVAVQQPLFTGFRISSSIKRADSLAAINRCNIEKTRREIKYTLTVAYWSIVRAREFVTVLDESIDLSLEHLKNVENLFSNGLVTNNDLLKVKMRLSEIRLKKLEAENMLKLAELRMSILLGLPKDTGFPFSFSNTTGNYELKSLDSLMDSAFAHRPEYAILLNKIKAHDAALTIARSGLYPSIFLKANYTYARPNQRIFPAADEFSGTWDIGIFASLDVGNYSRVFQKISQAETDLQKSREELDQTTDAIMFEITSNYIDYTTSLQNISLQQEIIDQAEENYKDVKEKFKSGVVLNQEVLEAENSLLQARLSYTGAVIDSGIALSALLKSAGETE